VTGSRVEVVESKLSCLELVDMDRSFFTKGSTVGLLGVFSPVSSSALMTSSSECEALELSKSLNTGNT
jgi:hypothetical protein